MNGRGDSPVWLLLFLAGCFAFAIAANFIQDQMNHSELKQAVENSFAEYSNKQGLYARDKGPERINELEKAVQRFAPWNNDREEVMRRLNELENQVRGK